MLIASIEEFQEFIPANVSLDIDVMKPSENAAEKRYIIPILGQTLYDELIAAYGDGSTPISNPELAALLPYVQLPLAKFASAIALPINQLDFSTSGIRIIVDDNHKTAFSWQIEDVKNEWFSQAYDGIETLLVYLEEHLADYPTWATSDAYSKIRKYFINDASTFNNYVGIRSSRQVYLALQSLMQKVEDFIISPRLGKTFYDQIKEQIKNEDISSDNQLLMPFILPAVAHFTINRAFDELPLEIRADGFWINTIAAASDNIKVKSSPDDGSRTRKQALMLADAEQYMTNLIAYLNTNAASDKYPLWFNSSLYVEPSDATPQFYDTSSDNITSWL